MNKVKGREMDAGEELGGGGGDGRGGAEWDSRKQ